jgi:hypothetical protein
MHLLTGASSGRLQIVLRCGATSQPSAGGVFCLCRLLPNALCDARYPVRITGNLVPECKSMVCVEMG